MLFNSASFLVFFPIASFLYLTAAFRYQRIILLFASLIFYMYFIPSYIFVLFVVIAVDYWAGMQIEKKHGIEKKIYLFASIFSTCFILGIFKYFDFMQINIGLIAHALHWNYNPAILGIIVPIGLSFHTFQSMAYIIEVYKGRQKSEKNIITYSLYVLFYPQLVAGPIERPQKLLPQFNERHRFDYERVIYGLQMMVWGFFKKMVIADNLATYVDMVYGHPFNYSGVAFVFATIFFAFQIYCDFSGYSDIALGSAKVLGFILTDNFKNPYFSSSVGEFWNRWHISLSTWFRDYIYIPLGGNRRHFIAQSGVILVVFLLSGLWHGAQWSFIIWGFINGIYLIIYKFFKNIFEKIFILYSNAFLWILTGRLTTFISVVFAWIFFRARSAPEAIYIASSFLKGCLATFLASMHFLFFGDISFLREVVAQATAPTAGPTYFYAYCFIVVGFLALDYLDYRKGILLFVRSCPSVIRWCIYSAAVLAIMNLGVVKDIPFIYYQF